MKHLLFALFILFTINNLSAQITKKAIIHRNLQPYKKGDTVLLYGIHQEFEEDRYCVKTSSGIKSQFPDKFTVLDNDLNFWDEVSFRYQGFHIAKRGWEENLREELSLSSEHYYLKLLEGGLLFKDEMLNEYIRKLLYTIHPTPLVGPDKKGLDVIVVMAEEADYFAFNNGLIVITTGAIASAKSETELIAMLSECIAHVVLESSLNNLSFEYRSQKTVDILDGIIIMTSIATSVTMEINNITKGTDYDSELPLMLGNSASFLNNSIKESMAVNYSNKNTKKAKKVANDYIKQLTNQDIVSDKEYYSEILSVLTFHASSEYAKRNFKESMKIISFLDSLQLAKENDYLLYSKCIRHTSYNDELSRKTISLLLKAKGLGNTNLIDLDKELALQYLRLDNIEKAVEYLEIYKKGLLALDKNEYDIQTELENTEQKLYKLKTR